MELYRLSADEFAHDLNSSGRPNRWNKSGEFVIYAGGSRSLVTLEMLVHRSFIKSDVLFKMMTISVPDSDIFFESISTKDLPANWRGIESYSSLQNMGSNWFKNKNSLILRVPSVIIPYENNYILNCQHPEFEENVKLVRVEDYFWDDRLL